jgi:hypothetical protein
MLTMQNSLTALLQLRLLVGLLGEGPDVGQWPTKFNEPSSRNFLEPVFAKTSRVARYYGVLEAARRVLDERLSVGSFHLFRLPEEMEQDLHALILSPRGEELVGTLPQGKQDAIEMLKLLGSQDVQLADGPMASGRIDDIAKPETIRALASIYSAAFSRNAPTFPYLVA